MLVSEVLMDSYTIKQNYEFQSCLSKLVLLWLSVPLGCVEDNIDGEAEIHGEVQVQQNCILAWCPAELMLVGACKTSAPCSGKHVKW